MENHVSLRSTDNPLYLHQDFLLCMSNATLRAIYSFRLVLFKKKTEWTLTLQLMNRPIFQQHASRPWVSAERFK